MLAGIITLHAGLVFFVIGVVALGLYIWLAARSSGSPRPRVARPALIFALLLLSNFPVAAGVMFAASAIQSCYTVIVHNTSQQPLERVHVFGGGCDILIESIPPGRAARRYFWIRGDDELAFECIHGASMVSKTIDGYVTTNLGGHTSVTVQQSGEVSVQNDYGR